MTPEEVIQGIDNVIREVDKLERDVELFAANQMFAVLLDRVFGQNKDSTGKSLGKYKSERWKKLREETGRPTKVRDLNFTGNLFGAFKAGTSEGKWVVGFLDSTSVELSEYRPVKKKKVAKKPKKNAKPKKQPKPIVYPGTAKLSELIEENFGVIIFQPSNTEVAKVLQDTSTYVQNRFTEITNKYLK